MTSAINKQNPAFNQTITLRDGRTLSYAEYGVLDGKPVFYFHGGNGSRYEGLWFEDAAREQGVRLIVPDRPGFGLSDFQANRTFLDWPDDIVQLADSLNIDTFAIFGLSGAGPHIAACAYKIPERLSRVAMISCLAPSEATERFQEMWFPVRMIFFFAKHLPAVNRFVLGQMGNFYSDVEQMKKRMLSALPEPEVKMIERDPMKLEIFALAAQEAHRQGLDGDAYEWQLYVNPWGFRIEDIKLRIKLLYGRYDTQATPAMGQYYAKVLPNNTYNLVEEGGHLSTINNHIDSILRYLSE